MKKILMIGLLLALGACQVGETGGSDTGTGGTTNTGSESTTDTGSDSTTDTVSQSTTEVPCTDCVSETLKWGWTGGLQGFYDAAELASCRTYTLTRTPGYGQPPGPDKTCTVEMGGCDADPLAIHDIEQALGHPDVVAALADPPPVYGYDHTAADFPLYRIEVGNVMLKIGEDCCPEADCQPCTPAPPGVEALAALLRSVDQQNVALPACVEALQ